MSTELYNKTDDKARTGQAQFDPVTRRFVFVDRRPDPLPKPDPQPKNETERYTYLAEVALAAARNTDIPERREYWLAQSRKAFSLAGVELPSAGGGSGPAPTSEPAQSITTAEAENNPPIGQNSLPETLPYSARIHSTLAQKIISEKEFTRSYALWCVLRSMAGPGHIDKQDVINLAIRRTGKAQSTIYNWLSQGEGIFWTSAGGRLWLKGKDAVIDRFLGAGVRPGRVVVVPVKELLTDKLHRVRAVLSATWLASDNGKIAARITRRNILQGVPERTQQTYDRTAGVKIRPLSVRSQTQKKQLSNQYFRPDSLTTLNVEKRPKNQIYGYRPTENNAAVSAQMSVVGNGGGYKFGGLRTYFNDQRKAVAVAEYRKKNDIGIPVYWLNPEDQSDGGPAVRVTWLW